MKEKVIELKNVNIGYDTKTVVEGVNASIYQGEIIGIIGSNGAGKSTFLKSIRGLLPLKAGEIFIFGQNLQEQKEKNLATNIAYLQQNIELGFDYTCKEIVLTGRYPHKKWWENESQEDEELVKLCMEYTGTLDLADRSILELSGGQRQRVLIAKILAQQTPIVLLDEPTTGLDMVYQEEIFRFAKSLAEAGKTVLMVVHELNLASRYCSRVMLIGEGKVIADDSPAQVLTEENLRRSYHSRLSVNYNNETGSVEIFTKPEEKELEYKKQLLNLILSKNNI